MSNKDSKANSQRKKKIENQKDTVLTQEIEKSISNKLRTVAAKSDSQRNIAFTDDDELTNHFLSRIFCRVRQIKENNPDISADIDMHEWLVKLQLVEIREAIQKLPEADKELVTILVVSGIQKMIEDLLDLKHEEIKDTDARDIDLHKTKKLRKR